MGIGVRIGVAAGATLVAAVLATPAQAATVGYTEGGPTFGDTVAYTAATGERNNADIRFDPAGDLTIGDVGIPMSADPSAPDTTVHCALTTGLAVCHPVLPGQPATSNGIGSVVVSLGDGADKYRSKASGGHYFFIDGGPGKDGLLGGPGIDTVEGGPGADNVWGGANDPAPLGGLDRVRYLTATQGVAVSLDDVANDGAPGEGDNVHSDVEDIDGTQFGDQLTGSAVANSINASEGDDVVAGLAGNDSVSAGTGDDLVDGGAGADWLTGWDGSDTLIGGSGSDRIDGNSGDDQIDSRDGEADVVSCGAGLDTVLADPLDTGFHLCEDVQVA